MSTGAGASDLLHAEDTGVDEIISGGAPIAARSPLQLFWRRFRRDKVAMAALGFIVLLIVSRSSPPLIVEAARRAGAERAVDRTRSTTSACPQGPSSEHLFGVDQIGRDVFSRVLYGARVSLKVAFIGTGADPC